MLCTHCAIYDDAVDTSLAAAFDAPVGASGNSVAGGSFVGGSLAAQSDRFYGGAGRPASAGSDDRGNGDPLGATGGSGTNSAAGSTAGGASSAGGASIAGGASQAGGAESVTDYNLSQGKPSTTDSEQSHKFHYASDGNDGDRSTRWCAANYRANHYWEVDLGQSFSLSALRILWEKDRAYLFKVESSVDHATWSVVLDKTDSSSTAADQHHQLPPDATGRYVRITVTGGLAYDGWASFYELEVFGH